MAVKKVTKAEKATDSAPKQRISFSRELKLAADTKVVVGQPLVYEDQFQSLYTKGVNNKFAIEPPVNPETLVAMCYANNTLLQCVQAMEVNIDGTGHTIEPVEADEEDKSKKPKKKKTDANKQKLEDFFSEPYPGISMITLRRRLRWDMETTGNAYIEVLRNVKGEVIFLRHLEAITMRLVKLDEPVTVEKTIERGGQEISVEMNVRERRFVQVVGTKYIFYKEYGASRQLDRTKGDWLGKATPGNTTDNLASEVLHFVVDKDYRTGYGIPRWFNQTPSVLGSRKAENFNLEFFDAGGVPPVIIFLQGGTMLETMRTQLLHYLSGGARSKQRAAVVEAQSTSGSIDSNNKVDVKVERFGDARQSDSMFQNYDSATEEKVRGGFRLPPIFLGKSADYNFATAMTSVMVTEAQVFEPERIEFDETINKTIVRELGVKDYLFVSNAMSLTNVDAQLKGLEIGKDTATPESFMNDVNAITGTKLELKDPKDLEKDKMPQGLPNMGANQPNEGNQPPVGTGADPRQQQQGLPNTQPSGVGSPQTGVKKIETATGLLLLVNQWASVMGVDESDQTYSDVERAVILRKVDGLAPDERRLFNQLLASKSFPAVGRDPVGLAEIASCCADAVAHE